MSNLSKLKPQRLVEVTVHFEDETMTVSFDRNAITPNWAKRVQEGSEREDVGAITATLAELLVSWDVVDDNGQLVPPSAEVLGDLPLEILFSLQEQILAATLPSSEEGNASSDTSSTPSTPSVEQPEIHQNGQATSPSPASSESLSVT